MKKLIAFLIFLLFLLLAWFSWNWYKQTVVCCDENVKEEVIETVSYGPLVFNCGSDEPILNDLWPAKKSEIISARTEGKKLLITGPYFDGEIDSMGISRAAKIKTLFIEDIDESNIELSSRKAGDCESTKSNLLHESGIKWVTRNEHVIELHDKTIVYFKYNTTNPIDTENVVNYLNDLIDFVKSNNNSIFITGHTDADGSQEFNYELGLKRANRARDYFVKNGIAEDKISVVSKGKLEPLSNNSTPEGRQKNRRVEIVIN